MKDSVSTLEVTAVPPAAVDYMWSDVEPMFKKAIDASGGRYNTVSVLDQLLRGDLGLWLVLDEATPIAAYTTRVTQYPTGRKGLIVDWLSGDGMDRWLGLVVETVSRYGKDIGCNHAEFLGRMGWLRTLKPFGVNGEAVIARMELSDE